MLPPKRIQRRPCLFSILLVLLWVTRLYAQPVATNRVLELDGDGAYVVLPPNIFTNLNEATVEVWAKWDSFQAVSRIFEFGAGYQSMSLFNHAETTDLRFNIYPDFAQPGSPSQHIIRVNDLLRTSEWIHLAAISGRGGMKLYANGVLVGEHTNAASFADIKVSQTNYFGRGLARIRGIKIIMDRWTSCAFGTTGAPNNRFARICSSRWPERSRVWSVYGILTTSRTAS